MNYRILVAALHSLEGDKAADEHWTLWDTLDAYTSRYEAALLEQAVVIGWMMVNNPGYGRAEMERN